MGTYHKSWRKAERRSNLFQQSQVGFDDINPQAFQICDVVHQNAMARNTLFDVWLNG